MKNTTAPFGTQFSETMTLTRYSKGQWETPEAVPVAPLSLHPGAHVLHYSGTCFDGLKAFRMSDGEPKIFRLDYHLARFRQSADLLCLPLPEPDVIEHMIREAVKFGRSCMPEPPGAL